MQTIADIILVCGALGVAFYCFVLSRRLKRFNNLEHGVGGAVAVLSAQVDDLNRALEKARKAAETSGSSLTELTERADGVARRLELHVAALHDLTELAVASRPQPASAPQAGPSAVTPAAEPLRPAVGGFAPGHAAEWASDRWAAAPAAAQQPVATHPSVAAPEPESVEPGPSAPSAPAAAPAARPVRSFFATARKAETAS